MMYWNVFVDVLIWSDWDEIDAFLEETNHSE